VIAQILTLVLLFATYPLGPAWHILDPPLPRTPAQPTNPLSAHARLRQETDEQSKRAKGRSMGWPKAIRRVKIET